MKTLIGLLIASSTLTIASTVMASSPVPAKTCEEVVQEIQDRANAIEYARLEKMQQGAKLNDPEIVNLLSQEAALLQAARGGCNGDPQIEPAFSSFGK